MARNSPPLDLDAVLISPDLTPTPVRKLHQTGFDGTFHKNNLMGNGCFPFRKNKFNVFVPDRVDLSHNRDRFSATCVFLFLCLYLGYRKTRTIFHVSSMKEPLRGHGFSIK
jgi:hypothetical protein